MTDDLKQKMDGIYGWSVDGDKIQPPIHRFPKAVKDRADYYADMNSQRVSLSKAIAIMQEWEISGLIFFTPSGQTALLKTR